MSEFITDFLAIIGVVLKDTARAFGLLGFASIPTAFAFLIGAVGNC